MRTKGCPEWSFLLASMLAASSGPHVWAQVRAACETWQPFVDNGSTGIGGSVTCLTTWDNSLVVGGNFINVAGAQRNCIVRWDGTSGGWQSFTSGGETGVSAPFGTQVLAVAVYNGDLIAAGRFDTAGGQIVNNIARWDATIGAWFPLTSGGQIGLNSHVRALAVWNGNLVAGGDFWMAGGQTVNSIAIWNGTSWSPIISGGQTGVGGGVRVLRVWGTSLVAGGHFTTAGGQFVNFVATWDGAAWTRFIQNGQTGVGGGSPQVDSLAVWNDSIVVGGTFTTAGGQTVNRIARWDGGAWHPFTSGGQIGVASDFATQVYAVTAFNDDLIAGGFFTTAGNQTVNNIARWTGTEWVAFDGAAVGVDSTVLALTVWNSNLVACGGFNNAGGTFVNRIARWEDCSAPVCPADIAPAGGDGVVNVNDLLAVINAWGPCGNPNNCPSDVAPAVNVNDLLAIINGWGNCP